MAGYARLEKSLDRGEFRAEPSELGGMRHRQRGELCGEFAEFALVPAIGELTQPEHREVLQFPIEDSRFYETRGRPAGRCIVAEEAALEQSGERFLAARIQSLLRFLGTPH